MNGSTCLEFSSEFSVESEKSRQDHPLLHEMAAVKF